MDFGIDGSTAWKIWLDGWTYGHIARKTEKLIRTLYEGRPPECPIFGGPCIGRAECAIHKISGGGVDDLPPDINGN